MNYITDLAKLVARKKVVPGDPAASRLFKRVDEGSMPPPGEQPRPSADDVAVLKKWIEAGAPGSEPTTNRARITGDDANAFPRPRTHAPPPRPPLPAVLHPHPPVQRRAQRRGTPDLPQRPGQARQQPVVEPADHRSRRGRSAPHRAAGRFALVHVGRRHLESR